MPEGYGGDGLQNQYGCPGLRGQWLSADAMHEQSRASFQQCISSQYSLLYCDLGRIHLMLEGHGGNDSQKQYGCPRSECAMAVCRCHALAVKNLIPAVHQQSVWLSQA